MLIIYFLSNYFDFFFSIITNFIKINYKNNKCNFKKYLIILFQKNLKHKKIFKIFKNIA